MSDQKKERASLQVELQLESDDSHVWWASLSSRTRDALASRVCSLLPMAFHVPESSLTSRAQDSLVDVKMDRLDKSVQQVLHELVKYQGGVGASAAKGRRREQDVMEGLRHNLGGVSGCEVKDVSQSKCGEGDVHVEFSSPDGKQVWRLALELKSQQASVTAERARLFAQMVAETPHIQGGILFASAGITGKSRLTTEECAGNLELEFVGNGKPIVYLAHQQDANLLSTICATLVQLVRRQESAKHESQDTAQQQWQEAVTKQVIHLQNILRQMNALERACIGMDKQVASMRKTLSQTMGELYGWKTTLPASTQQAMDEGEEQVTVHQPATKKRKGYGKKG